MSPEPRFKLEDAVEIFSGISIVDLRNWIKRSILQHVGEVPPAGKPREFDIYGLYEIALIRTLVAQGYNLVEAGLNVSQLVTSWKQMPRGKRPHLFVWSPGNETGGNFNVADDWAGVKEAVDRLRHRLVLRRLEPGPLYCILDVTKVLAEVDKAVKERVQ